jgi:menaquinone-dependent protoporphyrinogen oxidase
MSVLVSAASKHGATAEIAEAITRRLGSLDVPAVCLTPQEVTSLDTYDAVVLGSGVYAGHWLSPAKAFVERFEDELRQRPVWLFSSGPIGEPAKPEEPPVDVAALERATGAREHRIFSGRLDRKLLGFAERAMVRAVHATEGDFRDWAAIGDWTVGIASAVSETKVPGAMTTPTTPQNSARRSVS